MTHSDYCMVSLCLWREARGEGQTGMLAVACVMRNSVNKHNRTYYAEVVKPWRYSSMTALGDSQLRVFPAESDPLWQQAQLIASNVIDGLTDDITGGATLYWNPAGITSSKTFDLKDGTEVKFPESWNTAVVEETVKIGNHIFMKEN